MKYFRMILNTEMREGKRVMIPMPSPRSALQNIMVILVLYDIWSCGIFKNGIFNLLWICHNLFPISFTQSQNLEKFWWEDRSLFKNRKLRICILSNVWRRNTMTPSTICHPKSKPSRVWLQTTKKTRNGLRRLGQKLLVCTLGLNVTQSWSSRLMVVCRN